MNKTNFLLADLRLISKSILFFVNAAGCYLSYLLILKDKNQYSHLLRKFCVAGSHIDCNQVTKSRYSKLFGLIALAEAGMAYFVTVILWLMIAPLSSNWLAPLWWFILALLPFTFWSLFIQAFLIQKWCLFCCAIVLFLWINAGILYCQISIDFAIPLVESALLALLILVCTAAVMYARQAIPVIDMQNKGKWRVSNSTI